MEDKYIELLLNKCIILDKSKFLFINYDVINQNFIDKLVKKAKELGIEEIYLDRNDIVKEHEILSNIKLEDIENHKYFDRSMWNLYAQKKANFLIFRSPYPGIMEDIEPKKIARAEYIKNKTSWFYKKMQLNCEITWCIAALPNKYWADSVYKNKKNSFELLEKSLYSICMLDKENPIDSWEKQLKNNKYIIENLNNLKIKKLYYRNKLGTDLTIELLNDSIWCDVSTVGISNMPSYEIYTSPDFRKTNGIVYSSKPLLFNGKIVDDFWIKFKDGKAIECGAKKGEEVLKSIIHSDSNSCYLGECALVENDSPISNTNLVYGLTLIDENASCHLALGNGFIKCVENSKGLNEEKLLEKGLNVSKIHVDFMIGTADLEIEAETFDMQRIKIFENGNFKRDLIKNYK